MPLIKDIKDFKEVIGGVQKSISFATVEGFLRTAEIRYIIPILGEDFYNELVNYTGTDSQWLGLCTRLRIASGFYALAIGAPQLITAFGDSGIASTQGGAQPIGKWAYVELRDSSLSQADYALEDAIQYLEKHSAKKVSDVYIFPTWRASSEFSISNELFINSATELTKFFPAAQNARRVYVRCREYIKRAEEYFIKPLLGEELFNDLKSKLLDDNTTFAAEEKILLDHLRNALAQKAFSAAIPYLNLNADFRLVTETDGVRNEDPATAGKLNGIKIDCDNNAVIFSNKLKKYIDTVASTTVLPVYFTSETYKASVVNKSYYHKEIDRTKPFVSI